MNPFSGLQNDEFIIPEISYVHSDAEVLNPNTGKDTMVVSANGQKWYQFTAQKGVLYVISTDYTYNDNFKLFLFDSTTLIPLSSSNTREWTCASTGVYFVQVKNKLSHTGTCSITLTYDAFEPDSSFTNAVNVMTDGKECNRLLTRGDNDWLKFTAKEGICYEIKVTAGQSCKVILDSCDAKTQLKSLNVSGVASVSVPWLCKTDGIYYCHLTNDYSYNTYPSAYAFSIKVMVNDTFEQDSSYLLAKTITANGVSQSHILLPGDRDFLKFEAELGKLYSVTGRNVKLLNLYSTNGTTLLQSGSYTSGDSTTIHWLCNESGTYFLDVKSVYSVIDLDYTILINQYTNDSYEPDSSYLQAKSITANGVSQSRILFPGDRDFLKFEAKQGKLYVASVRNVNQLNLYSSDGTTLIQSGSYMYGDSVTIKWQCNDSGTYYLVVKDNKSTYSTIKYDYTISVNQYPGDNYEPDNSYQQAKSITADGVSQSRILYPGDRDFLKFKAEVGKYYLVTGRNVKQLNLYSTNGDTLIQSGIYVYGDSVTLGWQCNDSGTYYLDVKATYSTTKYDYTISVNQYQNDSYEPDNSYQQAKSITANGVSQARILYPGDRDFFKFEAALGKLYVVTVRNVNQLNLYSSDGTTLIQTGNYMYGDSVTIKWQCNDSGTYYLVVKDDKSIYSTIKYDYTISVNQYTGDNYEPDNSYQQAKTITADGVSQSRILYPGDRDFLKFKAEVGKYYIVSGRNVKQLNLYSTNGNSLIQSGSYMYGDSVILGWQCNDSGTYYLDVKSTYSSMNYDYTISVNQYPNDSYEPDSSYLQAKSITTNGVSQSRILYPADRDFLKFEAEQGKLYIVNGRNVRFLNLYSSDGSTLIQRGSNVSGDSVTNKWLCKENGTYFINAQSTFSSTKFDYTISVNQIPNDSYEPDNSFLDAKSITMDGVSQSHILFTGDRDFFKFEAEQGKHYRVNVQNLGLLQLYSSDGKTLIISRYNYNSDSVAFEWGCNLSGTYYLDVESTFSAKFEYTISISQYLNDSYEPDGTYLQAKDIEVNQTLQTHKIIYGEEDWLKFSASAGVVYNVKASMGTHLDLYSPDGRTLLTSNGSSVWDSSKITWTCMSDNIYYLKFTMVPSSSYTPSKIVQISVNSITAKNVNSETVSQLAKTVSFNDSTQFVKTSPGEQQWVKFSALAGTTYLIQTKGNGPFSALLFSTDLSKGLASAFVPASNNLSLSSTMFTWECNASETYYLKLTQLAKYSDSLSLLIVPVVKDAYEPDSIKLQAKIITTDGVPQSHQLNSCGDNFDYLKFTGTAGTKYTIRTSGYTYFSNLIDGENGSVIPISSSSKIAGGQIMSVLVSGNDTYCFYVYRSFSSLLVVDYTVSVTAEK